MTTKSRTDETKRHRARADVRIPELNYERSFSTDWKKDYEDFLREGERGARRKALAAVASLSTALGRRLDFEMNVFTEVEVEVHVISTSVTPKLSAQVFSNTESDYGDSWIIRHS